MPLDPDTSPAERRSCEAGGGASSASPTRDTERLFEEYSGRIYRYCIGRLGSPEEAEDALQTVYLNAWRSLESGTRPAEPRPWLFRIAANVCSTLLRARLGRAVVEPRDPKDFQQLAVEGDRGEELIGLGVALEALPERQRKALLLRDWQGLSYGEIATELDASYSAVETLLFRARNAVAVSLTSPARRARRTPVRSALSAIFLWPSLLSGLKSALSNATPAKAALGIAVGASAPLITFGVFHDALGPDTPSREPKSVVVGMAAPDPGGFETQLRTGTRGLLPLASASAPDASPQPEGKAKEGAGRVRATGPTDQSPAGPPAAKSSAPAPPANPSAPAASPAPPPLGAPAEKPANEAAPATVVICHKTGAQRNPGVTISVPQSAVAAHLAHGDELGPCA